VPLVSMIAVTCTNIEQEEKVQFSFEEVRLNKVIFKPSQKNLLKTEKKEWGVLASKLT